MHVGACGCLSVPERSARVMHVPERVHLSVPERSARVMHVGVCLSRRGARG